MDQNWYKHRNMFGQ